MPAPDPRERFSSRVEDYLRYRPRYPRALIDVLREQLRLEPAWVIADVGAGTGFASEPFLEHGNIVYAVEPNARMRAAAEALHRGDARFRPIDGTAEETTLPPQSIDLVVAAQAFHWFDHERARAHFRAILRPPHRVCLLWNTRRNETPFMHAYEQLLERFGTDYSAVRHDQLDPAVLERFFGSGFGRRLLPNDHVLDWPALRGRLLSSSYVPGTGDPRCAPMLDALREIFDQYQDAGRVAFDMDTEIYSGLLAS